MFTIDVQRSHIRAICVFAARQDVRYYLQGVCIESGPGGARLIATDGHRLAVIDPMHPVASHGTDIESGILPLEALTGIKKAKRGTPETITIHIDPKKSETALAGTWTVTDGNGKTSGNLVDGKFPDWRRVCAIKPTGIPQQFNAEYMGDYAKASKELGAKFAGCLVSHNGAKKDDKGRIIAGGDGAIVTIPGYPEFFSVVMAYRCPDEMLGSSPAWVLDSLQATSEQKAA